MGCCIKNAIEGVVYKPQKCISHNPAGWKSKVSVPSRSGPSEGPLPSPRLWAYPYDLPGWRAERENLLSGDPYKVTNPIMGPHPHILF